MKRTTVRMLLLLFLSVFSAYAIAQQKRTVTGTVLDEQGAPISGATFVVKGSRAGGATDVQGTFTISLTSDAPLVFSAVGFLSKEVPTAGVTELRVVLQKDDKSMDEVIVTGFGVKKETRKLAYAVTEIKGDEIVRASSPNVVNALQGKVAGVFINQGNGGPMSSSRIRIRGNTSLRGNTQPLVVIDGVILEPGTTGGDSWGSAQDFGNQMKNLNPDDYESISVLKGSAASALYGSQAQNGVLIITTKKGRQQKGLGVTVSHSQLFDKAFKATEMQNEFGAGINPTFALGTDGVPEVDGSNYFWSYGPRFNGQQVRDIDDRMITWSAKPNNILDAFQTGKFINTNVAVQGGTDKTTFRASYSNLYNTYVTPNTNLKRDAFALRITQKLSNFLTIDGSVNYSMSQAKNPVAQGGNNSPLFALAYFNPRNYDTKYWMNNYLDPEGGVNRNDPYGLSGLFFGLHYNNTIQFENTLLANLDLTANITPWLTLLLRGNINNADIDRETKNWGSGVGFAGGTYRMYNSTRRNTRLQALLTASKDLNDDFTISASLGGESQAYEPVRYSESSTNGGLKTPGGFFIGNSVNPATTRGGISNESGYAKRIDAAYLFGDVTWRNMLTLNFSARNDWTSSLLYPNDGHGISNYFYPGAGLAWIFTETFKNSSALDFLSFGKLRLAYAHTGAGVNPWVTSTGYYQFLGNYNGPNGLIPRYGFAGGTLGNLNIKNELTKEFEIGADLRFLNNRLGLDVAWYKKNSYNQLLPLALPSESGVGSQLVNAGNIQNQGIEILLTANPVKTKNFNWDMTVNFTRNRNKIIELAPGVTSFDLELAFGADMASVARPGKEYGTIITNYGYASYQAKDGSGNNISDPRNGLKVLKANGSYYRSSELGQPTKELGSMMENFLMNTSQNFRFKNIFLSFQIDSKFGGLMASATHQYGSTNGSLKSTLFGRSEDFGGLQRNTYDANGNVTGTFNDGIIPEGVFANGISIRAPNGQTYDVSGMTYQEAVDQNIVEPVSARLYYARLTQWSTGIREYSTFQNDWVAVREVSVGYTMPAKLASSLKLNSLRVSLIGRNLGYLHTTTKDGIHPEGGLISNRAGAFAEYGGVPYIRSVGFKVDAGF
ncbi:SusC/RagA family TonB-linked outer membrane protein [Flavihumibacter cheonanensis]|uniref:SusC/RagA family TonB-linked outer membrane protein n=1 Tax=Flavihumibacter cheonanensis TaxID=1442385 RepID=UPI001EF97E85|nr:SusC/RagA family TonB-linked outer membrane protein [Flavihumibacter cheonanensis]MCG7750845.1 SusC/RagA family TonB-linked outer membrane protein [Flavihumibacter cheonanensis]